jgi:hypothetical protein
VLQMRTTRTFGSFLPVSFSNALEAVFDASTETEMAEEMGEDIAAADVRIRALAPEAARTADAPADIRDPGVRQDETATDPHTQRTGETEALPTIAGIGTEGGLPAETGVPQEDAALHQMPTAPAPPSEESDRPL